MAIRCGTCGKRINQKHGHSCKPKDIVKHRKRFGDSRRGKKAYIKNKQEKAIEAKEEKWK